MPDAFRVATLGYGGAGSIDLPFQQYSIQGMKDFLVPDLPIVVEDFARGEECVLLCCWDVSRLLWLTPEACPLPALAQWLKAYPLRKWVYGALDAEGPDRGLSYLLSQSYKGFDRVLNYSSFSSKVTGYPDHLPHGIDTKVFYPRDKKEARQKLIESGFKGLTHKSLLVGIVATNQSRKDYALGIQTVMELISRGYDARLWIHTDHLNRFWDFPALVTDYKLQGRVVITTNNFTDEQMSSMYAACDVTLGIGAGEGFGYPLAESIASGTPVVHGRYAGGDEVVGTWMTVEPIAYRYEGPYCMKRPVFDVRDWADKVCLIVRGYRIQTVLDERFDWDNLWPKWECWLRKGLK